MDFLIEFLDFITSIFGESFAEFFDRKVKSRKIKAFLSVLSILIGVACLVGIIALIVMIFVKQ